MNTSQYNREYYKKNKERIKERRAFKNLTQEEREKILARNKKWKMNNREKLAEYKRKYRARIKENNSGKK